MKDKELTKFQFVLLVTVMFICLLEFVEWVADDCIHSVQKPNVTQIRGRK